MGTNRPNRSPFDINIIRPLDGAPPTIVTPTVRVRAQARKEQIMALAPDAPINRVPAARLRHPKLGWLIGAAAIPVTAAVILGLPAVTADRPGSGIADAPLVHPDDIGYPDDAEYPGQLNTPQHPAPSEAASGPAANSALPDDTQLPFASLAPMVVNFASWTPSPASVAGSAQQAIRDTCWADITASQAHTLAVAGWDGSLWDANVRGYRGEAMPPPWWQVSPDYLTDFAFLGAEARGDWGAAFWRNPAGNVAYCLTYTDPNVGALQTFTWNVTFGSFSWFGAIADDQGARSLDVQRNWAAAPMLVSRQDVMLTAEHGTAPFNGAPFNIAMGRVGPDVTGVVLTTVDGQAVTATVADDTFFAWWPGEIMPEQRWPAGYFGGWIGVESSDATDSPHLRCRPPIPGVDGIPSDGDITPFLAADAAWSQAADGAWVCDFEMLPDFVRRDSAVVQMTGELADGTTHDWAVAAATRPWAVPFELAQRPIPMRTTVHVNEDGTLISGETSEARLFIVGSPVVTLGG